MKDVPYEKSFANHEKAKYWDNEKNGIYLPHDFSKGSGKKAWFICNICNHSFESMINNIANKKSWCPFCCKNPQSLCKNDCEMCFNNSFASIDKSTFWDYNRNKITPREISKYSSRNKFWFKCPDCNHSFESRLDHVSKGSFCGYCSSPPKYLCGEECNICFNKSFASNEKSKYWNILKNKISPRNVSINSGTKYWFTCPDCKHDFNISPDKVTSRNQFCGYCSYPPVYLCKNECNFCFNKSFASHEKAIYWDYTKNKINPRDVFKYSSTEKYWFKCTNQHEFSIILSSVSIGKWCSQCHNKTETKFYEELQLYHPNIERQFKPDWCKNRYTGVHLPYDFLIPDLKIIIEVDDAQHFRQVSNWDNPEKTRIKDIYKMQCANKNGYRVIRIIQEDIFYDRTNWLRDILNSIKLLEEDKTVINIFIEYNYEYKNHKDLTIKTIYDEDYVESVIIEEIQTTSSTDKIIIINGIEYIDDLSEL